MHLTIVQDSTASQFSLQVQASSATFADENTAGLQPCMDVDDAITTSAIVAMSLLLLLLLLLLRVWNQTYGTIPPEFVNSRGPDGVPHPFPNVTERARCCLSLFNREVQFNVGCHVPSLTGSVAPPSVYLLSGIGSKAAFFFMLTCGILK